MSQNELSTDNGKRGKMTKLKKMSIFYFIFFSLPRKLNEITFLASGKSQVTKQFSSQFFIFFVSVGRQEKSVSVVGTDM